MDLRLRDKKAFSGPAWWIISCTALYVFSDTCFPTNTTDVSVVERSFYQDSGWTEWISDWEIRRHCLDQPDESSSILPCYVLPNQYYRCVCCGEELLPGFRLNRMDLRLRDKKAFSGPAWWIISCTALLMPNTSKYRLLDLWKRWKGDRVRQGVYKI